MESIAKKIAPVAVQYIETAAHSDISLKSVASAAAQGAINGAAAQIKGDLNKNYAAELNKIVENNAGPIMLVVGAALLFLVLRK